jgi:amidase
VSTAIGRGMPAYNRPMAIPDVEQSLAHGSIAELRAHLIGRRLSAEEAVGWYLSRIASISQSGPAINAVREVSACALQDARRVDQELASGLDRGPLHGIPVLLKDNILTADGMTASAGSAALASFRPLRDADIVRRLRQAGAIVLGKTNLTEFADYVSDVMPAGFSSAGGIVHNPHGGDYGRGQGSSVGSAASVAASLAMFAIGSETQNSIQTPAALSSVIGYKPSVGRLSGAGIFPLVPSQDSPGPLTRSVADAALVAAVLAGTNAGEFWPGPATNLTGVRIGVPRRQIADRPEYEQLMPQFQRCLSKLSRAGAILIDPCDLPSAEQLQTLDSCVFRAEFKDALNRFLAEHHSPCGIGSLQALIAWNAAHPDAIPYGQSLLLAANATRGHEEPAYRADRDRDLALSGVRGIDAALAAQNVRVLIAPMGSAAKFTGKAGAPVVTIPAGSDSAGLPFGISVIASVGDDAQLLAIAAGIERIIGERMTPSFASNVSVQ